MTPKYRFLLQIGEDGTKQTVRPNYKDDLTLDYELETNQMFYRKKLSGKLSFLRNDYEIINNAEFETTFYIYIEASNDYGETYSEIFKGKFHKTDCTINDDDKIITVQPEVDDQYNNVLAGMEKEYNLIDLSPISQYLTIQKRPLIQIYIPGDSIISCFLGGSHWEQDVTQQITDTEILRTQYHFSRASELAEIQVSGIDGAPNIYNGLYVGKIVKGDVTQGIDYYGNFTIQGKSYKIYYEQLTSTAGGYENYYFYNENNTLIYYYQGNGTISNKVITVPNYQGAEIGSLSFDIKTYGAWARYLCDVEKIGDLDTYNIPDDDIVDNNRNYKRVIGYGIDVVYISNIFSDEPTKWGIADDDKYYLPPYSIFGDTFYPMARSTWRYASLWFAFYLSDWVLESQARKPYTLRDAQTLASTINVLLKEFAPGITHEDKPEYSQFLYGTNPIAPNQKFTLLITQKSNILNGEYKTPAQKAPITLQQITDMLRNVFKCYWYVEDGKFKIEHVQFFRNGGSYTAKVIGSDLTKLENVRNGKKWAFCTSEYSFDKIEMSERYQFEWMDDVTTIFEGLPIQINSPYVTAGKIEEINVSNFTSDIDMMLLNPSAMSSDGFALFAAIQPSGGGQLELPIIQITVDGTEYYLQNGYLAFAMLQPTYWLYDMPARNMTVNEISVIAKSIEKKKKQSINFPVNLNINPLRLIKTYLGNGQIDKLNVNLSSITAKCTLKYDTE